jgi:methionine aminotransferase
MIQTKLNNIPTSIFTVMSEMAQEHDAINLAQGFPNFESDPILIELVAKAMRDGYNQYAPMAGDLGLRKIISNKTEALYSKKYNPGTEVTITAGATQAIFTAIATIINTGDEVIIFTPAYDCYEPTIRLFGGVTVSIQLKSPAYRPDWNEVSNKITSKTKMIIINTPHNPSGTLFSESDMRQLEDLAEKYNLIVISDEVYEHIVFDGELHQSASKFPKLALRSFIIGSFGKTFHNTGWKMGYCIASEKLTKEFQKVHQYNVFCANHPIQKALATYMEEPNNYLGLSAFYQEKRDFFLNLLKDSRFKIIPSKGTYFQLLNFSEISSESDITFAERLTKENKVAMIPTSVFNPNKEDFKQIRVCFAKKEETLIEAASILNRI